MSWQTDRIEVTADDIGSGEPGCPCSCPIALAIRRARPDLVEPEVTDRGGRVVFALRGHIFDTWKLPLPEECPRFVAAFDSRGDVEPFAFDLALPAN